MKQIGITSSGSVIIEMTVDEFNALTPSNASKIKTPAPKPDASKMTTAELVTFVKTRIVKLKPKKRERVVHCIEAMFQFNGGIAEAQTQKVIASLQKEKFLNIDADGKVKYSAS